MDELAAPLTIPAALDRAERLFDGRVAYVEALGRETLVGVDTDEGARLVTVIEGRARLEVGERLRLGLVEAGVRRF